MTRGGGMVQYIYLERGESERADRQRRAVFRQRRCVPEHCFLLPRVIHFDIV